MKIINTLCILPIMLAAMQQVCAEPVLRQAAMPVVCGKASEVLTEVSKSPFKPFISTGKGEGASTVFIDPENGKILVLRDFGDVVCFVAGGHIEKMDLSLIRSKRV